MTEKLKTKTDHSVKEMEERKKIEQLKKKEKVIEWYEKRKNRIEEYKQHEAKSKAFVMNVNQSHIHGKSRIEPNKKADLEEVLKMKLDEYDRLKQKEKELEQIEKMALPKI